MIVTPSPANSCATVRTRKHSILALVLMLTHSAVIPVFSAPAAQPLLLPEVLSSVTNKYPPYLAALIEMDIANGRARQSQGAFDLNMSIGGSFAPAGFYDGQSGYVSLDQPLSIWGGNVYGGYRLSSGFLPDYNKDRTQQGGEALLGFRLNLLRDGAIDRRRATLYQAQIDQQLADPFILRQYLDFIRAASIAYYNWLAAGFRWQIAEELFAVAKERDAGIAAQAAGGAVAPIVRVDNERLVVSRQIAMVQAQRRFEAASIELSLFYRDAEDQPIRPGRDRLSKIFPEPPRPDASRITADIGKALLYRPETRRLELTLKKLEIDRNLAKNNLLPNLDIGVQASQAFGKRDQKDIEDLELEARVELKMPLQRNEAKGRLESIEALIERLGAERRFTTDRIAADVRDAHSALEAAHQQLAFTQRNVDLSRQLEEAEAVRFKQGAADLFMLQIREQATFDARLIDVEAHAEYLRSLANYRAAIAADAPPKSEEKKTKKK